MNEKKSKLDRIYDGISLACADVGMVFILAVMLLTLRHGIGRYFFNAPMTGAVDLTCFGIVIGIFLCVVYTMNKNEHVAVGMFMDLLPKKIQRIVFVFTSVVALIFLFSVAYEMVLYAPTIKGDKSNVLYIPKQPFFYVVAFSFFMCALGAIVNIMKTLREYTKPVYAILIVAAALAICAVIIIFEPWSALFKRGNALSVGIVGMIIFMLLMFLKLPVAISMGTAGFFVIGVYMGWGVSFGISGSVPFASLYNYTWSTVPMFVLMGYLAKNSELAEDFYFGIRQWVGHRPGGLLHAVVIGNGAFGACSGDSIGAAVTFCSITLPETRRYGYDDSLTLGCIAGGSVLATTIPPSMMFIVYGACTQTSIGHMFIAGIIPGVLLVLAYMALVAFIAHIRPDKAPRSEKPAMKARLAATPRMLYLVVVFVVIIGGIYAGIFSPTEAGAFGSAAVLIIGVLRRKLTWKKFLLSCREAACTLGMIGLVLVGSGILQRMIVLTNLTSSLSNFLIGAISSPFVFFLVSGVILLILGCFIDALPLLLLIAPIFYPIAVKMGIDPVHYGVFMTMTIMIGTLTPPVGITVYALAGQVKELAMGKIFRGVMPFVVVLVIVCLLVALIEPMSTWLPSIMYG